MIRVLHCLGGLGSGGAERLVINWYRNIDRSKIQFDFLVRSNADNYIDEIKDLGGRIFYTASYPRHAISNAVETIEVLKRGEWDVIHVHGNAAMYITVLLFAKKYGIKYRIMHSHSTNSPNMIFRMVHYLNRPIMLKITDLHLACSNEAGQWMYGKAPFRFLKNAIELDKFFFRQEKREEIREKYTINDKFVLGLVGRFSLPKNHKFLLEIFKEVKKRRENAVLLLVGEGELYPSIVALAQEMEIGKDVLFVGKQSNVGDFLSAMDVFVMPSLWEGLPVSLVEAQANGLVCFTSQHIVQDEVLITELIHPVVLEKKATEWAEDILSVQIDNENRTDYIQQVMKAGFDVKSVVTELESIYINGAKCEE